MNWTVLIRRKRRRIQREIDNLQEESPFRTTQFGTSRQQVAKGRNEIWPGPHERSWSLDESTAMWFHFLKRRNSKKLHREITFHKNALFSWLQRKVFVVHKLVVCHLRWTVNWKIWNWNFKKSMLICFISAVVALCLLLSWVFKVFSPFDSFSDLVSDWLKMSHFKTLYQYNFSTRHDWMRRISLCRWPNLHSHIE